MRLAIPLLTTCLLCGCSASEAGDELGGSSPSEGGGSYASGGGGPGVGGASSEVDSLDANAKEPPLDFQVACPDLSRLASTPLRVRPRSIGGFASAQYARSALGKGQWPDPTVLRLEDFEAYYGDRLPVTSSTGAEAIVRVTEGPDVSQLDVRVRLRAEQAPQGVHVLVLADVSPSTDGTLAARESMLDELARSVDADGTATAKLSIITFGEVPEVMLDRVPSGMAFGALAAAKSQLAPRPGNDLRRAVAGVEGLLDEGLPTHVLLITDGGVKWDEALDPVLSDYRNRGVSLSIAQIGNAGPSADFLNDELLERFARSGGGTRLFLPGSDAESGEVERIFRDRFQELFSIASGGARLTLVLPPGIGAAVETDGSESAPAAVGFGRPFGTSLDVTKACDEAFDSLALIEVGVVDAAGTTLYAAEPVTAYDASHALGGNVALTSALQLTVQALRSRQVDDVQAAIIAATKLEVSEDVPCDAVTSGSCQVDDICCIRADLLELLQSTCGLFHGPAPEACEPT